MRLSAQQIEALQLWAIGANGGDPTMSHVSGATCMSMRDRGLVRPRTGPEESPRVLVPTDAGYAELARLMTPRLPRTRRS